MNLKKSLLSCLVPLLLSGAVARAADEPIRLGTRRELFIDRHLIERLDGAQLKQHHPVRREVVLRLDRPWEGIFCGYFTVIKDGPRYRMYYRGLPATKEGKVDHSRGEVTCVVESDDGIHFTRPNLGLVEVAGTRDNNVILAAHPACHNFSPFLDTRPGVPTDERYKAVGGNRNTGLLAFVSADGIHFKPLRSRPILTGGAYDSQNVICWSSAEGQYVCYFRVFRDGVRSIARITSIDFLHWSEPVVMHYGDAPREHLYTSQTHPYFRAPHLWVSFPKRFMPGRRVLTDAEAERQAVAVDYRNDCSDGVFMTSRGGDRYDRTFMEAFFRPGLDPGNWGSRSNMAVLNVVPTGHGEMSIYYSQHYAQPSAHIVRCTLRTDGFASVHGPYAGGEVVTRPFTFGGSKLLLNYSTSAAGGVRVELQDAGGQPLPGFALDDCTSVVGDRIDHEVRWKPGADLSAIAGRIVRMRMELKDADVFAFQFAGETVASAEPAEFPSEPEIVDVRKIWDAGPHNAFTDLLRRRNRWFCVFREAPGHVSPTGSVRVITSTDGQEWSSAALLDRDDTDLRDPKISIAPDGRLMLLAAAARHEADVQVSHQPVVWFSDDGHQWSDAIEVGEPNYWLWRITWHQGAARGVGYGVKKDKHVRLYESRDGRKFDTLVENLFCQGYPNETSLLFNGDEALCLLRRDGTPGSGQLGTAHAPYTKWTWRDLGVRIGGPHMIRLADGRIVAAVRLYDGGARTSLAWLDPRQAELTEFLKLPSGGDTSYAGLVEHDGLLWVSYYSSHEGKTSIYLARVKLP